MLVVLGLLPWSAELKAGAKGIDVYLFLSSMMLLSELAHSAVSDSSTKPVDGRWL
ncbi:MAG: hypothetical protein IVW54_21935 [Candidatus Binataceae bacterium]|nr:hypothetical protein [Candidatus Binataceae bacterium]